MLTALHVGIMSYIIDFKSVVNFISFGLKYPKDFGL